MDSPETKRAIEAYRDVVGTRVRPPGEARRLVIVSLLCGALAAAAVSIPTAIFLTKAIQRESRQEAQGNALSNCRLQAQARPQSNARVVVEQVIFQIAIDRGAAGRFGAPFLARELMAVNGILAAGAPYTGRQLPPHVKDEAELAKYLHPLPAIDCKSQLRLNAASQTPVSPHRVSVRYAQ